MSSTIETPPSKKQSNKVIAGWIITGLIGFAFIASGVMKFVGNGPEVEKELARMGLSMDLVPKIAILELACVAIYLFPRTTVIGAILLTGYIGGAILTHVRVGDAVYIHIVLGLMIWLGIYLREPRLWSVIPWRK